MLVFLFVHDTNKVNKASLSCDFVYEKPCTGWQIINLVTLEGKGMKNDPRRLSSGYLTGIVYAVMDDGGRGICPW